MRWHGHWSHIVNRANYRDTARRQDAGGGTKDQVCSVLLRNHPRSAQPPQALASEEIGHRELKSQAGSDLVSIVRSLRRCEETEVDLRVAGCDLFELRNEVLRINVGSL